MRARLLVLALLSVAPAAWSADAEGCRDLPVLPRLPGCTIRECRARDYDEAELQSGPVDRSGDFPKALVDGELAVVTYACPASLPPRGHRAPGAGRAAPRRLLVRLRRQHVPQRPARLHRPPRPTWVQLVSEPLDALSGYTVTMVRASEVSGAPPARTVRVAALTAPPR